MSFIPKEHHHCLKEFKYTGGSDSLSYKYLWSPLAEYLLKFIPNWMAPNVITLIGLSTLILVHVLFMLPDDGEIPKWKFFLMAASIIAYQHLDNMDGKQARRTKSSSPIGMLFDHGADVFSSFLISIQVQKSFKVLNSSGILAVFAFIMSVYFMAMWSQYSIGFFRLGRINPVDEGLPAYAFLAFMLAFIDQSYFEPYHIFGTIGEEFIICLVPLLILQLLQMGKYIVRKAIRPKVQVYSLPLLYIYTGLILIGLYLVQNDIFTTAYFPIIYTLMFLWARNMILIQLYFITKQKYKVLNRGTNLFIFFGLVYIIFHSYLPCSAETYFWILCVLQGILFFEFAVAMCQEGAEILDIYIFAIKHKQS